MFTFAHKLSKTAGEPDEPRRLANVVKMSIIEHFPSLEGCTM
jgi:hypothetical protein